MAESAGRQPADSLIRKLARVAVRAGANVAEGQDVFLLAADVAQAPIVRVIAEESYLAGARMVSAIYWDKHLKHSRLRHAPTESLDFIPDWFDRHIEECNELGGAYIEVAGDPYPNLFEGIDPDRVGRDRMPWSKAYIPLMADGRVNWTVIPGPTLGMAEQVLGEADLERLWDVLTPILRLDADDPEQAWRQHIAALDQRAAAVTAHEFDHVHFYGPGTDLRVGLIQGSRWVSVGSMTSTGRATIANLPSEEILTAPDRYRVEGTVTATKPVPIYGGPLVEGLRLQFESGRVVKVEAKTNAEAFRSLAAVDPGAAYLGEVALVDRDSSVARSGYLFYDVLLDENAASHIAIGQAYSVAVPDLPEAGDERKAIGFNESEIHQDFMIGGPEVAIDGVDADGNVTPLIRDGIWLPDLER